MGTSQHKSNVPSHNSYFVLSKTNYALIGISIAPILDELTTGGEVGVTSSAEIVEASVSDAGVDPTDEGISELGVLAVVF